MDIIVFYNLMDLGYLVITIHKQLGFDLHRGSDKLVKVTLFWLVTFQDLSMFIQLQKNLQAGMVSTSLDEDVRGYDSSDYTMLTVRYSAITLLCHHKTKSKLQPDTFYLQIGLTKISIVCMDYSTYC